MGDRSGAVRSPMRDRKATEVWSRRAEGPGEAKVLRRLQEVERNDEGRWFPHGEVGRGHRSDDGRKDI